MAKRKKMGKSRTSATPLWAKRRSEGQELATMEGMTYCEFLIRERGLERRRIARAARK
jgi:hypothetical protein